MKLSCADLSSARAYSAGTTPFISDTLCYHSGGCGAFEHLLSHGKRERGSSRRAEVTVVVVVGMCMLGGGGGGGEQSCAPSAAKLPPFCLREGNWDAKPARASHSRFPFSLFCHSLKATVAALTRHGRRCRCCLPPAWLPFFHSLSLTLSLMISCFLCSSLPCPPIGAQAWQRRGHQGEDSRGEQEAADRKDGRPPALPPLRPLPATFIPLPHLSCTVRQRKEKVLLFKCVSFTLQFY